jgi:hypothetical protein
MARPRAGRHSSMTSWLITMGVPRTRRTKLHADTLHQTSLLPYLIVTIQRSPSFKRESPLSVLMSLIDVAQAPWSFFQDTKFSNVVSVRCTKKIRIQDEERDRDPRGESYGGFLFPGRLIQKSYSAYLQRRLDGDVAS